MSKIKTIEAEKERDLSKKITMEVEHDSEKTEKEQQAVLCKMEQNMKALLENEHNKQEQVIW